MFCRVCVSTQEWEAERNLRRINTKNDFALSRNRHWLSVSLHIHQPMPLCYCGEHELFVQPFA